MADADEATVTDVVETAPETPAEDVALEDIEVTEEELEGESEDDGFDDEPAKPTEPEFKDKEEVEEKEETEDDAEAETEESEPEEDTTPSEPDGKTQKELAHEAFKRREAERKLREERDARESQDLKRYLDEAEDDEAELAKRQTEVERHFIQKERISLNAEKLEVGIQKFASESELLKSKDPVVQEAIAEALDDFEAMYVVKDDKGNPIEVKADVYQYLQKKEDSFQKLTGIGARKQTKQKADEKTRTVPRPTRTPKEPTVDKDVQDFEDGFN